MGFFWCLGDLGLLGEVYYSLELCAEDFVPEVVGEMVDLYLEEDGYFNVGKGAWEWVWWGAGASFGLVGRSLRPKMLARQNLDRDMDMLERDLLD